MCVALSVKKMFIRMMVHVQNVHYRELSGVFFLSLSFLIIVKNLDFPDAGEVGAVLIYVMVRVNIKSKNFILMLVKSIGG